MPFNETPIKSASAIRGSGAIHIHTLHYAVSRVPRTFHRAWTLIFFPPEAIVPCKDIEIFLLLFGLFSIQVFRQSPPTSVALVKIYSSPALFFSGFRLLPY
jgi:hypothetical protein